jgi:hypothetical protein
MRASIVTQILCHVYAYMNNLEDKETDIHGGLLEHMRTVKEKTGQDWENDSLPFLQTCKKFICSSEPLLLKRFFPKVRQMLSLICL